MITPSAPMRAAACCVAVVAVAGCTPTTTMTSEPSSATPSDTVASPSPSQSPTPSVTFSAEQQAAIDAVEGYSAVSKRVGAAPSKFTEKQMRTAFSKYLGGEMLDTTVASFVWLKQKGWRYVGDAQVLSTKASKVVDNHNSRGLEVHVTACRDQSKRRIVDSSGKLAKTEQPPKFNLRQYSVRQREGSNVWRVYGISTAEGKCGA